MPMIMKGKMSWNRETFSPKAKAIPYPQVSESATIDTPMNAVKERNSIGLIPPSTMKLYVTMRNIETAMSTRSSKTSAMNEWPHASLVKQTTLRRSLRSPHLVISS